MFKSRLEKLRKALNSAELDGMLIFSNSNRFYISGFHGSNGLLYVNRENAWLVTDFRYIEQATAQAPEFEVVKSGQDGLLATLVEDHCDELGVRIGIEKIYITLAQDEMIRKHLPDTCEVVLTEKLVEDLRRVKYPEEIELLKRAQVIAEKGFNDLLGVIKPEMTEQETSVELEIAMRRHGSGPVGFDVIVGAGPNAALPHHYPDDTILGTGRSIVIDFGATHGWYNSDTTRTIFLGSAPDDLKEIYNIVLEAQIKALEALDEGKSGFDVDKLARDHISAAGHEEHFGHGLGHGIGIDVHEGPNLSGKSEDTLEAYNIFSVEPGIYIPDCGGVRIEDLCWIKPGGGYENITSLPKDLLIL